MQLELLKTETLLREHQIDATVVVSERENVTAPVTRTGVARCRRTAAPALEQRHLEAVASRVHCRARGGLRVVVHDDHLEPTGGILRRGERAQTVRQQLWAPPRGDHDRARGKPFGRNRAHLHRRIVAGST